MGRRWIAIVAAWLAAACSQRVEPEEEAEPVVAARQAVRQTPGPGMQLQGMIAAGPEAPRSDTAVLFVVVRPAAASGGPPLAALRLPAEGFPQAFAIGPADAMIPGTVFPERVIVEARLDQDGDPLTRGADDWAARSGPVAPGVSNLRLDLARPDD